MTGGSTDPWVLLPWSPGRLEPGQQDPGDHRGGQPRGVDLKSQEKWPRPVSLPVCLRLFEAANWRGMRRQRRGCRLTRKADWQRSDLVNRAHAPDSCHLRVLSGRFSQGRLRVYVHQAVLRMRLSCGSQTALTGSARPGQYRQREHGHHPRLRRARRGGGASGPRGPP